MSSEGGCDSAYSPRGAYWGRPLIHKVVSLVCAKKQYHPAFPDFPLFLKNAIKMYKNMILIGLIFKLNN